LSLLPEKPLPTRPGSNDLYGTPELLDFIKATKVRKLILNCCHSGSVVGLFGATGRAETDFTLEHKIVMDIPTLSKLKKPSKKHSGLF